MYYIYVALLGVFFSYEVNLPEMTLLVVNMSEYETSHVFKFVVRKQPIKSYRC